MEKNDDLSKEIINEFIVKFNLYKKNCEQNGELSFRTLFGLQNQEDNILYFYYHILDIAKNIVSGDLIIFQLPEYKNDYFENHKYAYQTKELLEEYMLHILKEIVEYNKHKSSIDEIKS